MRRCIQIVLVMFFILACGKKRGEVNSETLVTIASRQDSLFKMLMAITQHAIPDGDQADSLGFLILPVQASCPSCRSKVIDSIVKHADDIRENRYVIISANGGTKLIGSFFIDEHAELPMGRNWLIIDSINQAHIFKLYDEQPTIYYTFNRKVYKMVASVPMTVKKDLNNFFSVTSF